MWNFAIGQFLLMALDYAPAGTLACNGQIVPIDKYVGLFSAMGTQWGGNGTSTFALPDIPAKTAAGQPLLWVVVSEGAAWGASTESLLGEVRPFPNTPPPGELAQTWLPCDGRTLNITDNETLFILLGTQFGGD